MSKECLMKGKDSTGNEQVIKTSTDGTLFLGASYNSSITALTTGQTGGLQLDSSSNLKVTLATTIAGEDITNDVMKVEERFTGLEINTAVGTTVKTGSGFLHGITINNPGSSWEIDIYDGTSSSGTKMATVRSAAVPTRLNYNFTFATGLFIDTVKGTTVGDITVSYR
jgi:hypothetical protein